MPVLIYSSDNRHKKTMNVYSNTDKHYILASRLIDAIFKGNKRVVERDRFTYIPSDGYRKMVIRLKRL